MKRYYYIIGYDLGGGIFNVIGATYSKDTAELIAKEEEELTGERPTIKRVKGEVKEA